MAANNSTTPLDNTTITTAQFRALYQFLAATWQAGGFTKVTDAAQVDTSTMTFPAVNNTAAGYEVRQFTDSLQATKPVFVKLEPARAAGAGVMGIYVTVGTTQDGAGTIGGILYARTLHTLNSGFVGSAGSAGNSVASASTHRFHWYIPSTSSQSGFVLERTITNAKVPTNVGVRIFTAAASYTLRHVPFTGTAPGVETVINCSPPVQQTSGLAADNTVCVYHVFPNGIGTVEVPLQSIVGVYTVDVTQGSPFTARVLGSDQIMWPVMSNANLNGFARSGSPGQATFKPAFIYE